MNPFFSLADAVIRSLFTPLARSEYKPLHSYVGCIFLLRKDLFMSNYAEINEIEIHWMPLMTSCTLNVFRGGKCEEGVTIRPNVASTEQQPEGWQHQLSQLEYAAKLSLKEAQDALSALGLPEWAEEIHNVLGRSELRGITNSLKFWVTCHSPAGMAELNDDQLAQTKARLFALRTELWG